MTKLLPMLALLLSLASCTNLEEQHAAQLELERALAQIDQDATAGYITPEQAMARARSAAQAYAVQSRDAMIHGVEQQLVDAQLKGGGLGSAFAALGLVGLNFLRNRSRRQGNHLPGIDPRVRPPAGGIVQGPQPPQPGGPHGPT